MTSRNRPRLASGVVSSANGGRRSEVAEGGPPVPMRCGALRTQGGSLLASAKRDSQTPRVVSRRSHDGLD